MKKRPKQWKLERIKTRKDRRKEIQQIVYEERKRLGSRKNKWEILAIYYTKDALKRLVAPTTIYNLRFNIAPKMGHGKSIKWNVEE